MKKLALLLLATGIVLPVASIAAPAEPKRPALTVAPPAAGKGQVVFFRKGGLMGAAISCAVHENGAKLSSLSPGKYVVVAADPGVHQYSVKSEATDTLRLEVEAGETYYAQCTVGMGVMAGRPNLSPSDAEIFGGMKLKPVLPKD
jgi:hypothetical protein